MVWTLLLLFSHCSVVLSDWTLTQPASHSTALRGSAQLSCTITGVDFGGLVWIQQPAGKNPRFLLRYTVSSDKTDFGPEFSTRFSASVDSTKRIAYLSITDVEAKDEAGYYCTAFYQNQYIFGSGTQLSITGLDPAPPKLNVYPPSPEEIKTTNKATLVCLVQDFNPGTIQVDWLADGTKITQNVETSRPKKQGDKYISSSYLTLNRADWERQNCYKCRVTHEGKRYEEPVNPSQCSSP